MSHPLRSLLSRRPRGLDLLHRIYLARPSSQTNEEELGELVRRAEGRHCALEIGTYQGVSAALLAGALTNEGILYCVDPWPAAGGRENPCWRIARRHFHRTRVTGRVKILRGTTEEVQSRIPHGLDFVFIDGDHSRDGIAKDWEVVAPRVASAGIVCLHDVIVPPGEPWRTPESVSYFEDVITHDARFELLGTVHSMAVVRKR